MGDVNRITLFIYIKKRTNKQKSTSKEKNEKNLEHVDLIVETKGNSNPNLFSRTAHIPYFFHKTDFVAQIPIFQKTDFVISFWTCRPCIVVGYCLSCILKIYHLIWSFVDKVLPNNVIVLLIDVFLSIIPLFYIFLLF